MIINNDVTQIINHDDIKIMIANDLKVHFNNVNISYCVNDDVYGPQFNHISVNVQRDTSHHESCILQSHTENYRVDEYLLKQLLCKNFNKDPNEFSIEYEYHYGIIGMAFEPEFTINSIRIAPVALQKLPESNIKDIREKAVADLFKKESDPSIYVTDFKKLKN